MNDVKMRAEGLSRATRSKSGKLYLGSIDMVTATNWAKECGCGIGTKEYNIYAKKKLMSGDFNKFKADVN